MQLGRSKYYPLVQGLGWFSIGLGLAELLAPRQLRRASGLNARTGVLRGYGVREIATGLGLLLADNPRPWLWGRVIGDGFDLATTVATADTHRPKSSVATLMTLLGALAIDYLAAAATPAPEAPHQSARESAEVEGHPS